MNVHNLDREEMESLYNLLGKMLNEDEDKKEPLDKMIDEIMDEFNFATVHKTMVALDWKWASSKNYIPSMDELRAEAERLLRDVADVRLNMWQDEDWKSPIICSTGGFSATAWCNEDKTKIRRLELEFIVSSWKSRID
jgi:coenzyme F420-reducing hydrogenase alpha subunit